MSDAAWERERRVNSTTLRPRQRFVYEASLWRTPIGWGFTLHRDGQTIGRCHRLLTIFNRSRTQALDRATLIAQHDHDRYRINLPI